MGRPAAKEQRHIADDIIAAAEVCIAKGDTPRKVSLKEIALMAGTNQAMIAYYFGSKDGLLTAILDCHIKEINIEIGRFRQSLHRGKIADLTRETISFIVNTFHARPVLGQILNNELVHKDSPIRDYYTRNWSSNFCNLIGDVLRYAIDSGAYRPDLHVNQVFEMIRALVYFPMLMQPYKELFSGASDAYANDRWIDSVSELLDAYLRPSGAIRADMT